MSFVFDYSTILYGPVYASLGVPAVLTLDDSAGDTFDVTVIDKTAGIAIDGAMIGVQTIKPVAMVRAAELATNSITPSQLENSLIFFNSENWRIESHRPMPSPGGEGDGEIMLILISEPLPTIPANAYVAEDGVTAYIAEDGAYYVQET